jgi:hypothetical protein
VVDLEGNSKPIEQIQVGEMVLARNEFEPYGPLELKRVEEKFVRTAAVMELVIGGQTIKTTAEHPFYVPAQERFVPAGELQVGDLLVSSQGTLIPIESITSLNEITTVYNLRVADHHTYFVGGALWGWDVWVHNAYTRLSQVTTHNSLAEAADSFRSRISRFVDSSKESIRTRLIGGNVGVIRYLDPHTNTIKEIAKYSRQDRTVNGVLFRGGHGEVRAWRTLVRRLGNEEAAKKAVQGVFSELSPCRNCESFFNSISSQRTVPLPFGYRFNLSHQYLNHLQRNKSIHNIK